MVLFVVVVLDLVAGGYFVVCIVFEEHFVLFWVFDFLGVLWVQNILRCVVESDIVHVCLDFWLCRGYNYDTNLCPCLLSVLDYWNY